jgi:hypothetical protein
MRRTLLLLALLSSFACRKPPAEAGPATGHDAIPAPPAADAGGAPEVATPVDASTAPSVPAATVSSSDSAADALRPHLTARGDDWLVAWEEDNGSARHVVAAPASALAAGRPPAEVSAGPSAWGIRVAAEGGNVEAVWFEQGASGSAVRFVALGPDGAPAGSPETLSGSDGALGPPEIAAWGDGFVVVWAEGARMKAARLGVDGRVVDKVDWPGSDLRPWGPINDPSRGEGGDGALPAPPESSRLGPSLERPWIFAAADGLHVAWNGGMWFSDDQAGSGTYERLLTWPLPVEEPMATKWALPVWGWLQAYAAAPDGTIALQQFHDPNGGPWQLTLFPAGAAEPPAPLVSEAAGPIPAVLASTEDGLVLAWYGSAPQGISIQRLGFNGAATGERAGFPGAARPGERSLAIATSGKNVRIAYVDREGARTVVRVVDPAAAGPLAETPPAGAPMPVLPLAELYIADPEVAHLDDGSTVLAWIQEYGDLGEHAWLWRLLADGTPMKSEPTALAPGEPRCEAVTVAPWPGGRALAAWACCAEPSMCSPTSIHMGMSEADGRTRLERFVLTENGFGDVVLAVSGTRVALVTKRGEYSKGRVKVRLANVAGNADPLAALQRAQDVELPAFDGDNVGAPSAAWTSAGLLVAYRDGGLLEGQHTLRLALVDEAGTVTPQLVLPDDEYGPYGHRRLVATSDGAALVRGTSTAGESQVVVSFLSADGATEVRRGVAARGQWPRQPDASFADGVVAAAWYDAATDGEWVALVSADGTRLLGPNRIDEPAARASSGYPVLESLGSGAGWRVWWGEPYTHFRSELKVP